MHLLEVALQGVRGFSPTLRLPLQTGFTVLRPASGEAAPLGGLVAAVLLADGRGAEASFSAQKEKPGRAALTFLGNDGHTYRLVRELGSRSALQRISRNVQTLETVAQDAPGILQVLRGPVGLPGRTAFEELFVLAGAQRPSVRARARPAPAAGGTPSGGLNVAQHPVTAAKDVLAARARVTELEAELALSREVAQLQFDADGTESDLYQLASRLAAIDKPRQALAEAQAALAKAPTPASLGLPDDILTRVERYPAALKRRDEALARLQAERERAAESPAAQRVEPLLKDRHFLVALAAGLVALVVGALLSGGMRALALLDIPLFGFAATRALRFVEALQRAAERTRKDGVFAAREKKVQEEFDAEAGPVLKGMATLDVETPEELAAALAEFAALTAEVHGQREAVVLAESDPARQADLARQQELQAQLARLNAELEKKGTYVRDVREVERELSRVRESLALAEGGAAVSSDPLAALHEPLQDPCPGLLGLAAELLQADLAATTALVRDRLQQYFAALTDKRYGVVEFAPNGRATVQLGTQKVPVASLPPKDLDLLYLCLRLTLVEKLAARVRVPLLVEDAFGSLEEAKYGLVGRMLKHLGTLTQVVQVAVHPAFVSEQTGTL